MDEQRISINAYKRKYIDEGITPEQVVDDILLKCERYRSFHIWIEEPQKEKILPYIEKLGNVPDYQKKPLWGIPFAIKDNIDMEGYETTAACPEYAYLCENSATVVQRLIEAGAIPIGKTNMDQFATGLVGTRSPYGEVHNAVNEELISGGSSSGSAVSVALGEVAFSLGTDTAGSGRVPASLNGLVGWKPSVGAWPTKGVVPACASLDCVTVFANNVEDADLVDRIVRGHDREDKWSKAILREEDRLPQKIIIPKEEVEFYGPYADRYKKAWTQSIAQLREQGIRVVEEDTEFYQKAAARLYGAQCVAERWSDLGKFVQEHGSAIFPVTKEILESGNRPDYTAEGLYRTLHELQEYKRLSNNLLEEAVLVFPTCAGTYTREQVRKKPIETNSDMGKYTNHCNLLDMCAMAVPTQTMEDNMPFGITIFTKAEQESLLFGLAKKMLK